MIWTQTMIRDLRCATKTRGGYWPDDLVNTSTPGSDVIVSLNDLVVGGVLFECSVRLRRGQHDVADYSVILMVRHHDTGQELRLMRANGPHPSPHRNQLDKRMCYVPPETSHVHYLTERYLQAENAGLRIQHDGFAIRTRPYLHVHDAIEVLTARAHIVSATPTLQAGWGKYLP